MLRNYIKLFRVSDWVKNLFVFVPLIFSKNLFHFDSFEKVFLGFIVFSLVSSIVYIFNDIIDIEQDRKHPKKKLRPLANGSISVKKAIITIVILIIITLPTYKLFPSKFNYVLLGYLILNFFYTISLKKIVILDILCIAGGFMLRVIGGAYVISVYVSSWLILTTLFISLFLAIMKRYSELAINKKEADTRKVLEEYSLDFAKQIASITAAGIIISYALYTVSSRTINVFHTESLIYTTVFVVFGVFRYMFLIYEKNKGENTVEILLKDFPMMLNILLYLFTIVVIIY